MLVLYAVVPGQPNPGVAAWAESAGAEIVREREVAVVYERVTERPGGSSESVLALGARLTALAQGTPLLPMRYGSVVAQESELRDLIERRAGEWAARLSQVAGHDELIVHASQTQMGHEASAASVPASAGRAYLERRAAEHRASEQLEQALTDVVRTHSREVRALRGQGEIRLACLVAQASQGVLRAAVDGWAAGAESRSATVTGPFPAFSFAEAVVA